MLFSLVATQTSSSVAFVFHSRPNSVLILWKRFWEQPKQKNPIAIGPSFPCRKEPPIVHGNRWRPTRSQCGSGALQNETNADQVLARRLRILAARASRIKGLQDETHDCLDGETRGSCMHHPMVASVKQ